MAKKVPVAVAAEPSKTSRATEHASERGAADSIYRMLPQKTCKVQVALAILH